MMPEFSVAFGSITDQLPFRAMGGELTSRDVDRLFRDARRFRSRAPASAEQLHEEWEWATPQGATQLAKPGDWKVNDGRSWWSVTDAVFRQTYKQIEKSRYQRTAPVEAVQVNTKFSFSSTEGAFSVEQGDWLVRHRRGAEWAWKPAEFRRHYLPIREVGKSNSTRRISSRLALLYLPTLIGATAIWGFVTVSRHAEPGVSDSIAQRLWATVTMFTGGYIPLSERNGPQPPADTSAVGIVAFLLTLAAVGSAAFYLSARFRNFVRLLRQSTRLVVIGSGAAAAAIIETGTRHGISTVQVADQGKVGESRPTAVPVVAVDSLRHLLRSRKARRVLRSANQIAIATDSDALNLTIEADLSDLLEVVDPSSQKTMVLVRDPSLADNLRPPLIRRVLPETDITCPAENIAEHVGHLIDAIGTNRSVRDGYRAIAVKITDVPPSGERDFENAGLAPSVRTWLTRQCWSRQLICGQEGTPHQHSPVVNIRLLGEDDNTRRDELFVHVIVGESSISTAAFAFQTEDTFNDRAADIAIVVADAALLLEGERLRSRHLGIARNVVVGRDWLNEDALWETDEKLFVVVDPAEVGFDARLVADDLEAQWARTFGQAHSIMFAGDRSIIAWQPGSPLADATRCEEDKAVAADPTLEDPDQVEVARRGARKKIGNYYSSVQAVNNMLEFLSDLNFELVRRSGCPQRPDFRPDEVDMIARREHESWRTRYWTDTSRTPPKKWLVSEGSGSGAEKYSFESLLAIAQDAETDPQNRNRHTAEYNRRIARETYPAIAASFGYEIRRCQTDPGPKTTASKQKRDSGEQ